MDEKYILFVSPGCPYCEKAIISLLNHKKSVEITPFERESEALQEVKTLWGHQTVPICLLESGDELFLIGGSDDLEVHLNEKEEKAK